MVRKCGEVSRKLRRHESIDAIDSLCHVYLLFHSVQVINSVCFIGRAIGFYFIINLIMMYMFHSQNVKIYLISILA